MSWTRISPPDVALQRRAFRHDALLQWRVGDIVTTLPALLQLSLVLFLIGLTLLLHTLNRAVEIAIATTVALTLSSVVAVIVLPAIHKACPYKSPVAWAFVRFSTFIHDVCESVTKLVRRQKQAASSSSTMEHPGTATEGPAPADDVPTTENVQAPAQPMSSEDAMEKGDRPEILHFVYERSIAERPDVKQRIQESVKFLQRKYLLWKEYASDRLSGAPRKVEVFYSNFQAETLGTIGGDRISLTTYIRPKGLGRTWDQRDSEAQSVLEDPVRDIAWKCRSLLWAAGHENLEPSFLLQTINGLRCSTIAFEKSGGNDSLFNGVDNPFKRLCAYWLAIAQHLEYQTGGSLELNNHVWELYKYGLRNSRNFTDMEKFPEGWKRLHHQLAQLDPLERFAMFQLLSSGIHAALDWGQPIPLPAPSPPFTEENLKGTYLISMHMLRILCHRRSHLHTQYIYLVLRMLKHRGLLEWSDDNRTNPFKTCTGYLDDVVANVDTVGEPLRIARDHYVSDCIYQQHALLRISSAYWNLLMSYVAIQDLYDGR
jgi:hypothetical protein